jgi:hypothetical protein
MDLLYMPIPTCSGLLLVRQASVSPVEDDYWQQEEGRQSIILALMLPSFYAFPETALSKKERLIGSAVLYRSKQ